MEKFFERLDSLAQIDQKNSRTVWLDRTIFIFLLLLVLFAPHSIAASQTAWLSGFFFWIIRLFFTPRPRFLKTPLNYIVISFGIWSVITAVFSYAPDISVNKLRSVGLFFIFFFIVNNLRSKQAAIFLAFALIASSMINVVWTPIERLSGRGVKISGVSEQSLLNKSKFKENASIKIGEGDTIVSINKKKIYSADELVAEIEKNEVSTIKVYRPDYYNLYEINKADLLTGSNSHEKLGIASWKPSRNWRSQGFFGHYTTYAEVLQLIASLAFGLLIAALMGSADRRVKLFLGFALGGLLLALLLTVTRASQAAFAVSAFVIVLLGSSRKMLLILLAVAIPAGILGLVFLEMSREVSFFDKKDNSITWREQVYDEGLSLVTKSPRNMTIGVGMDSIKRFAGDWHLFADGKLPAGHFHSTPLQLAVERGLPALAIWLIIMLTYGMILWKKTKDPKLLDWREKGLIWGSFGGMIGFFVSGLVHYNLGDGEVAMIFFLLMGLSVFVSLKNTDQSSIPLSL